MVGDSYNLDANGNYRYAESDGAIGDQDKKGKQPPPKKRKQVAKTVVTPPTSGQDQQNQLPPPPQYGQFHPQPERRFMPINPNFYIWAWKTAAPSNPWFVPTAVKNSTRQWLANADVPFVSNYYDGPKTLERMKNAWANSKWGEFNSANRRNGSLAENLVNWDNEADVLRKMKENAVNAKVTFDVPPENAPPFQGSYSNRKGISLQPSNDWYFGDIGSQGSYVLSDVLGHERSHQAQGHGAFYDSPPAFQTVPDWQLERLEQFRQPDTADKDTTDRNQIRADLMGIRTIAYQLGIHNAGREDFTEANLQQLINTGRKNRLDFFSLRRLLKAFGKDGLIWAMNNIAKNDEKSTIPDNYA